MSRGFSRPGLGELVGSMICLLVVFTTLLAVDQRVRDRVELLVNRASAAPVATFSDRAGALRDALVQAARDRTIDQAPLLVFSAVGAALLIFMLRT
jgi:hypothetical protein